MSQPLAAEEVLSTLGKIFDVPRQEFGRRRHGSALRAIAAHFLIGYAGLSQREVGDLLALGSGAAVCNQLNRLPAKTAQDPHLKSLMADTEEMLKQVRSTPTNQGTHP